MLFIIRLKLVIRNKYQNMRKNEAFFERIPKI